MQDMLYKKLMRIKIVLLLLLGFAPSIFAETIILKSGQKVEGKIIEKTDHYIKIDFEGLPLTYYFENIESIDGKHIYTPKDVSSATIAPLSLSPQDIFKEVSQAVVYIAAETIGKERGLGSGFIIDPSGLIVTNYHVVSSAEKIFIKLQDGRVYPVTSVVHYDVGRDLCLIKIEARGLPFVSLGDSRTIKIGEKIYVIGNPLGLEYSFSDGLIAGVRDNQGLKYLQFTAPVSPGNSGGPIINAQGRVVGIVTFVALGGQNLNFALAINEIKPFIRLSPAMPLKDFVEKVSKADYYYLEGKKVFMQGDFDQAISYYTKSLQINPRYTEVYSKRGTVYRLKGNFEQAISDFNEAIAINPQYADAYIDRSYVYGLQGNFKQAFLDINTAIALEPSGAIAYNNRGFLYGVNRNFELALRDFNNAIEINPHYADAYGNRGDIYLAEGYLDQALFDFNKAIEIDPRNAYGYFKRGKLYIKKDDLRRAFTDFDRAIAINPRCAEAYSERGYIYAKAKEFRNAFADFDRAIDINPRLASVYHNRGLACISMNNLEQAIDNFNKVIEIEPKAAVVYEALAHAYFLKKDYDRAWQNIDKAQNLGYKINPKFLEELKRASGRQR